MFVSLANNFIRLSFLKCLYISQVMTLKMVLDTSLLSNIRYVSRVKWSNPGKGVAPFPTPWCSSYWKGSLLVALDYGCQLYLLYIYIYIYTVHMWVIQKFQTSPPPKKTNTLIEPATSRWLSFRRLYLVHFSWMVYEVEISGCTTAVL